MKLIKSKREIYLNHCPNCGSTSCYNKLVKGKGTGIINRYLPTGYPGHRKGVLAYKQSLVIYCSECNQVLGGMIKGSRYIEGEGLKNENRNRG